MLNVAGNVKLLMAEIVVSRLVSVKSLMARKPRLMPHTNVDEDFVN